MKYVLFSILFGFSINLRAQSADLSNSKWLSENQHFIKLTGKSAHISELDFIHSFRFSDTMIEFIHDYSHILSVSKGKKEVPRRKYEVPNSFFKLISLTKDSLILQAINPAAYYVATLINSPAKYLNEEDIIKWNKSNKKPSNLKYVKLDSIVKLSSYLNSNNPRHIQELKLTTSCFAWTKYYSDMYLDSTGLLRARFISQGYNDSDKPEITLFKGQLDQITIDKLDSLLSYSGIGDNELVTCNGFASHSTNVDLEIEHSKGQIKIVGIRGQMSDMMRALFDFIERLKKEEYMINELDYEFTNSKFGK